MAKKDAIGRKLGRFLGNITPWEGGLLSGNARLVKGMAGRPETERQPLMPLKPGQAEGATVTMNVSNKGGGKKLESDIASAGGHSNVPSGGGRRTGMPVRAGYNYDYNTGKYVQEKRSDDFLTFLAKLIHGGV